MFARKSAYFVLPLAALVMMACSFNLGNTARRGSGNVTSEDRAVSGFNQVSLSGSGDLYIEQGDEEGLVIEAEDNLLQYLTSEVRGDTLEIGIQNGVNIMPTRTIRYELKVKDLSQVSLSGSGNVYAERLESGDFRIRLSGSGDVTISGLQADSLDVNVSGSGNFDMEGEVESQTVNFSGSGRYRAGDLASATANLTMGGSGEATLWVTDQLDVRISGSGDVKYYGDPKVSSSISGSGNVSGLGSK